ncbi:hypothetical protein BDZ45DRAFT_147614 [Acephala macrosclerotiorum]|nr:hypothetical protein BDZ45DRAFT_147614 [Acephala macrosclerotiorum]
MGNRGNLTPSWLQLSQALLDCPEDALDSDLCLQRFPKKLKPRLEFAKGKDAKNKGWGIYIEEKRGLTGLGWSVGLLGVLMSLVFGVCWNVKYGDIQGAWVVASWIVAVFAIALFMIQTWGLGI